MNRLHSINLPVLVLLLSFFASFDVSVPACSWDYPIWQNRDKNADPYYRFVRDGMVGYIDKKGKIVVQPSSTVFLGGNGGGEFHDGLLLTGVNDGPYLDTTGKIVLDIPLYHNWDFSEGLAAVMPSNAANRWGYIDRTGKFVIEPKFESYPVGYVSPFADGMAMIEVGKQYGFIDTKGNFAIPPSYLWARGFSEGRARVIIDGPCSRPGFEEPCDFGETLGKTADAQNVTACKFGFIDKSGHLVGTNEFEDARDFSEGLAAVQKNGKWGFIDKTGNVVIPFKFGRVGSFSDGLALAAEGGMWDGKRWGYINTAGKVVIPFQFERAEDFSDGLAPVAKNADVNTENERWYYIDKNGNQAFRGIFALASPFFKGIGHVKQIPKSNEGHLSIRSGRFSYIDEKGRPVFNYEVNDMK